MVHKQLVVALLVASADAKAELAPADPTVPRVTTNNDYGLSNSLEIPLDGRCEGLDGPLGTLRERM